MIQRIVGVDVGGTSVKLAAVEIEQSPRVVVEDHWQDHHALTPVEAVPLLAEKCLQLAEDAGWPAPEGVGLGLAGLVDGRLGILTSAPNLESWTQFPFVPALEEVLPCGVRAANDATAFAMAEWRWGAGRGSRNAVFLTLGTGVGGGLVCEGRLVLGHTGMAGEPGHVTLDRNGPRCPCGNSGCAEYYVGRDAVVRAAREHPRFAQSPLAGAAALTPELLFEEAEAGNPVARDVWNTVGEALGDLLVSLTNVLNPERFVLGGGISGAGEWILEPARARLETRSLVARKAPPEVVTASLGPRAGVVGAAGLWANEAGDVGVS